MTRLNENELARLLRRRQQSQPPAQLAQRIKDEIPERIVVGASALRPHPDREHALAYRQLAILVALLLVALGTALWGLRSMIAGREREDREAALARLLARGAPAAVGWRDPSSQPDVDLPLHIDPAPFTLARALVEGGRLPAPELVQPAAFVSALDYRDPAPLTGELAIFAEGATTPATASARLVRITLSAADPAVLAPAVTPAPIAYAATARLAIDPETVVRYRVVAGAPDVWRGTDAGASEDLLPGHRVTILVELDLASGVPAEDRVLTVSATWRRRTGAAATLDHTLLARDVAGTWDAAPVSLRLAALAADLAGALAARPGPDGAALARVAREAESLAARCPADQGMSDFARLCARAAAIAHR